MKCDKCGGTGRVGETEEEGGELMECDFCKKEKGCFYRPNPFAEDVLDDTTPYWLCGDCLSELAMDI